MKQLKLLATTFVVSGLFLFLSSCNQDNEKKGDNATEKNDSSTTKPANILFIKHRVTDYDKWLAVYESHDSVRQSYGLHNYGLSRGIDDPSMVLVALKIDDMNKAKAFVALPDLKATMQKGGVEGEPVIMYYDRQMFDVSTTHDLDRVMVSHRVKDWETWKKEFESHKQARVDAGLKDRSFGYEVGDELYSFNNRLLTLENSQEVVGDFMAKTKVGDKLVIEVYRKDKKGNESTKKLKAKVKPVKVTETDLLELNDKATEQQINARKAWLGIN